MKIFTNPYESPVIDESCPTWWEKVPSMFYRWLNCGCVYCVYARCPNCWKMDIAKILIGVTIGLIIAAAWNESSKPTAKQNQKTILGGF